MMAKRLGKDNSSQDWNNYVNIGSSPSLCLPRRSKRLISLTVTTLLSTFVFSTVLVHSFSLHSTSSKRRQFRPISFTSSFNHQQPMNVRLGAITDDSIEEGGSIDNNDFASPTTPDTPTEAIITSGVSDDGLGAYDPSENLPETKRDVPNVGDPQLRVKEKDWSVTSILKELAAIQQQGPQKYCILGTRHCSYLHQQIIELLAYALVLSGNHVYTSGAPGTNAATVRGALRAEREDLLTVILPQSLEKQTKESQELLEKVDDLITMPQNDNMSLDVASRICNSYLLSQTDQLISFAFHESTTVIEASKEAQSLDMLVTTLYLD